MIMIIAYHLFLHCIKAQLTDSPSISASGNDCFCHPYFSKRLCILALISPMGQAGNAIFLMISGYFMAHKDSVDLTKISKKLLLQLGFSAMLLGFSSIYAYTNIDRFPPRLIPFTVFNNMSWFVGYYFIVMVIAKVFLNQFLDKLDRKKLSHVPAGSVFSSSVWLERDHPFQFMRRPGCHSHRHIFILLGRLCKEI